MGRKKKTEIIEETNKKEERDITINTSSSTSFTYKGEVDISIKKNGRINKIRTVKNTGYKQMFRFLTECLAGQLRDILKPENIVLLNTSVEGNLVLNNIISVADMSYLASDIDSDYVTYHFIIPYQSLSITNKPIHKIALYNNSKLNEMNNGEYKNNSVLQSIASAIIELTNPINISGLDSSSSILINWTMSITAESAVSNN